MSTKTKKKSSIIDLMRRIWSMVKPPRFIQGFLLSFFIGGILMSAFFGWLMAGRFDVYKNLYESVNQYYSDIQIQGSKNHPQPIETSEPLSATEEKIQAETMEEDKEPHPKGLWQAVKSEPENTDLFLPIIRSADRKTIFDHYRQKTGQFLQTISADQKRHFVSFLINNYGLSVTQSDMILKNIPAKSGLILSPYALNPQEWIDKATQAGMEVWIYIPINKDDVMLNDNGRAALAQDYTQEKNQRNLYSILSAAKGYVGVAMDLDKITATDTAFSLFYDDLKNRGVRILNIDPNGHEYQKISATPYVAAQFNVSGILYNQSLSDILPTENTGIVILPMMPAASTLMTQWLQQNPKKTLVPPSQFFMN
jgi:hypothetical protein